MKDSSSILIVGGGVIGLCCGYFLAKSGHKVTIVDRDPTRRESCSDQNAGMIVPSHFTPMAAPGMVHLGLKWMLNRRSPFSIRPRADPELWRWCWQFFRHTNRRHVENCQELLRDLSLESRELFHELSGELGFNLVEKGLLMLCRTEAGMAEEKEVAEAANQLGIQAEICSPERLYELDPDVDMAVRGGIWYPQDAHLDSMCFLAALRCGIEKYGGSFLSGEVVDFASAGHKVQRAVLGNGEQIETDRFVIAGGAWTPQLAGKLGLHLMMEGGKGYSFTLTNPAQLPQLCSLLKEGRVAVTPMGDHLRVAGTMEICGNDLSIAPLRLQGIVDSFCESFPAFSTGDFADLKPWSGLRPCTPDGLPYIGQVPSFDNAFVATGHSMLGLSLGPVTGRIMSDLMVSPEVDSRINPDRFRFRR